MMMRIVLIVRRMWTPCFFECVTSLGPRITQEAYQVFRCLESLVILEIDRFFEVFTKCDRFLNDECKLLK